jgi:hypothetical protein
VLASEWLKIPEMLSTYAKKGKRKASQPLEQNIRRKNEVNDAGGGGKALGAVSAAPSEDNVWIGVTLRSGFRSPQPKYAPKNMRL